MPSRPASLAHAFIAALRISPRRGSDAPVFSWAMVNSRRKWSNPD
jgi:hypothetical protein